MKAKMNNLSIWINNTDERYLTYYFYKLLLKSKFNIIKVQKHKFKPYGYTCLFLLGESHFAIHTFPECNKTYIELSSCVDKQFYLFKKYFFLENKNNIINNE